MRSGAPVHGMNSGESSAITFTNSPGGKDG